MNTYQLENLFTPDYSHLTGLVKHLNAEELQAILNSDDKVNEIISDLKQVKDIEAEREMLIAGTKSISEFNLSKKSILEETRENLETNIKRSVELKENLLSAKQNIESKSQARSKDTLLALLQAATSEIEEEAEATVGAFLKSELSVEDFLEKYLELRKLAHLRRIKSEKLASIIQGGAGTTISPERPQRLRKPPAPPVPNPSNNVYPNFTPFPYPNPANQNIPVAPMRPAPQPPHFPQNNPYPTSFQSPFTYCSPYPMPQPSNYPTNRRG